MIIKYTDLLGKPITEQQLQELDEYKEQYFDNGKLKKSETYSYSVLSNKIELLTGTYFSDTNDNLESLIPDLLQETNNWLIYFDRQINTHGDVLWRYRNYIKSKISIEGIRVFDTQQRIIAECMIDIETQNVNNKYKFFYGDPAIFEVSYVGAEAMTFRYNNQTNALIDVACDFGIYMDVSYDLNQFLQEQRIMDVFPWNQHTYYHNFEPMLP